MQYKIDWSAGFRCVVNVENHPLIKYVHFSAYKRIIDLKTGDTLHEYSLLIESRSSGERTKLLALFKKFPFTEQSGYPRILLKDSMEAMLECLLILANEVAISSQDQEKIESFIKTCLPPKPEIIADFIQSARQNSDEVRTMLDRALSIDGLFKGALYELAEYFLTVHDVSLPYEFFTQVSEDDPHYQSAQLKAAKIAANLDFHYSIYGSREEDIRFHCQNAGEEGAKFLEQYLTSVSEKESIVTEEQPNSSLHAVIAQKKQIISEQQKEITLLRALLESNGISLPPKDSEAIKSSVLIASSMFSPVAINTHNISVTTTNPPPPSAS